MSEPRKICFYSIATNLGGAERSLLDLVRSLDRSRYEPWVLVPKKQGPLVEKCQASGISVTHLEMPRLFLKSSRSTPVRSALYLVVSAPLLISYLVRLMLLWRREKPALIHTTGIKCHFFSVLAAPLGIPILWHLRDIFRSGPVRRSLSLLAAVFRVNLVANSVATGKSLGPTRFEVIYNGLDPAVFKPSRNPLFKKTDGLVIGLIGVLARWKGQREFVEMALRVLKNHPDSKFLIIGDEIYDTASDQGFKAELKKTIKAQNLEEQVILKGFLKDSTEAINGLDILVHASLKPEPFGRVILEAMACGVPVVASRGGGVTEFVEDGKTGLLFEPGNISEMQRQVERYIQEPALRTRISEQALAQFKTGFSLKAHVDRIQAVYDKIFSAQP